MSCEAQPCLHNPPSYPPARAPFIIHSTSAPTLVQCPMLNAPKSTVRNLFANSLRRVSLLPDPIYSPSHAPSHDPCVHLAPLGPPLSFDIWYEFQDTSNVSPRFHRHQFSHLSACFRSFSHDTSSTADGPCSAGRALYVALPTGL